MSENAMVIAVIGASGQQGGSVVRALQSRSEFRARALTRTPARYQGSATEVVYADLNRPETLEKAFEGAYGVFAVTNFFEEGGVDEIAQGEAAVHAAKRAGVTHFIWSTLPNAAAISRGQFAVPHLSNKASVDAIVAAAGFQYHTFVVAPFYYQNLTGLMAPQPQPNGLQGWTLPIDPEARVIQAGDVGELGPMVAGAFDDPRRAGGGQYLRLAGGLVSFGDIVATLNAQGHAFSFGRISREVFSTFFPGAAELAEMFAYFEENTFFGPIDDDSLILANQIAGGLPTDFATWAAENMPVARALSDECTALSDQRGQARAARVADAHEPRIESQFAQDYDGQGL